MSPLLLPPCPSPFVFPVTSQATLHPTVPSRKPACPNFLGLQHQIYPLHPSQIFVPSSKPPPLVPQCHQNLSNHSVVNSTAQLSALQDVPLLPIDQSGHKPGKHGKPGRLREFEKLLKSQGKLREIFYFYRKTWKTQGKCKIRLIIVNENVSRGTFLTLVFLREKLKIPWKSQGKLRELSFSKMWSLCWCNCKGCKGAHPGSFCPFFVHFH